MIPRISRIAMSRNSLLAIVLAGAAPLAVAAGWQAQSSSNSPANTAPDNTAQNKQQTLTADQQSNSEQDRKLARQIRKSIVADKSLSTYAHNVKIIVTNGSVTLKGPVQSEDEKKKIGDLATQAAGSADKVTNEVSVKS